MDELDPMRSTERRAVDRLRNWQGRDATFAAKVMEDMMRECADLKSMKAFVLELSSSFLLSSIQ
jgi:hypothetical protein